ncbi:pentapeptide repeat-containing protein [Cumulibacter soli]|uniref:pentapeptide repeat-containing protein n=1 Tax=Cumulibacter soli TaxID=2546344 RepID=UPI0010681FD5|nr:pentapeptide repeat-containing protein [Cumulibacter soli]
MSRRRGADRQRPAPPVIRPTQVPIDALEEATLSADAAISRARITGLTGDVVAPGSEIEHSSMSDLRLDVLEFSGARLVDVLIQEAQITALNASGATLRRSAVIGGRIGVLDLSDADVSGVEVRGARIDYLRLDGARVRDLLIVDCTVGTMDLPEADIHRGAVVSSSLGEIDTRRLRAVDLDLRGSGTPAITDITALRGATLTEFHLRVLLPAIAAHLGIDIAEDPAP